MERLTRHRQAAIDGVFDSSPCCRRLPSIAAVGRGRLQSRPHGRTSGRRGARMLESRPMTGSIRGRRSPPTSSVTSPRFSAGRNASGCRSAVTFTTSWVRSTRSAPNWTRGRAAGRPQEIRASAGAARPFGNRHRVKAIGRLRDANRWKLVGLLSAGALLLALVAAWTLLERADYFWRNPLDDSAVSDPHRFRHRAGRRRLSRRPIRGVRVRPQRPHGRLGHSGRHGTVLRPDARSRARARQSIGSHAGLLAGRIARDVLGARRRRGRHC